MAKMTHEVYLEHAPHCVVISNAATEYAEDTVAASFTNPPIKMTVLQTDQDELNSMFDVDSNPQNHPEIVENPMQALRGELPGWMLTGVNISADGVYLVYRTEHKPVLNDDGLLCGDGVVFTYGSFKLLFEVDYADGMPVERYVVKHCKVPSVMSEDAGLTTSRVDAVYVTKYIGKRKRYHLELRMDNHGQPFIPGRQYCLITEY